MLRSSRFWWSSCVRQAVRPNCLRLQKKTRPSGDRTSVSVRSYSTSYLSTRVAPSAVYSGTRPVRVGLVAGDGIGQTLVTAARKVLESAPVLDTDLQFVEIDGVGWAHFEKHGTTVSDEALETLRGCDAALFGAVCSPRTFVKGYQSPIVVLRNELDLFVNLRPLFSVARGVDALVVRENTEDLYVGVERLEPRSGGDERAVAERHITRSACRRTAQVAFEQALHRAAVRDEEVQLVKALGLEADPVLGGRRGPRVTAVHKANIMPVSDGLFLDACRSVARSAPFAKSVQYEDELVDIAVHDLVSNPSQFDVIVATNVFGDLVQDVGAALCGGLGVVPTANVGCGGNQFMLAHGSLVVSPSLESDDRANPLGHIRAAAMLLSHFGETLAAAAVERGAYEVLSSAHGPKTPDLGGSASTKEVRTAVVDFAAQAYATELFSQGS